MRNWASPNVKKGRTLRKEKEKDNGHVSSPPPRPQSAETVPLERREIRRRARNEDLAGAANGRYAPTPTSRPLPLLPARTVSHRKSAETTTTTTAGRKYVVARPLELHGFVANEQSEVVQKEVYWPLDLLPESCPSARIYTFGFKTITTVDGQLVEGQLDIFSRGRELLDAVNELRRITDGAREMVFVAHSTGGIVVKEVGHPSAFTHFFFGGGFPVEYFGLTIPDAPSCFDLQRYLGRGSPCFDSWCRVHGQPADQHWLRQYADRYEKHGGSDDWCASR